MRNKSFLSAILVVTFGVASSADFASAQPPATNQGAVGLSSELRLVVITDDDFLSPGSASWCAASLDRVQRDFQRLRPQSRLSAERKHAGPPQILAGGRRATGPRRALAFLCDTDGAVAGFCVGVPTAAQLVAMTDDANDVAILRLADELQEDTVLDLEQQPQDPLVEALHERARGRVLRHYRPLLGRIDRAMPIAVAAAHLLPALAADRGERFLIAGPEDSLRWVSAQQHVETMRHWCDAMLPSVVAQQADALWPELAAVIWDAHPWQLAVDEADLIDWYLQGIATGPVVLSIDASVALLGQPPVPPDARSVGDARGVARGRAAVPGVELPQHQRLLRRATHRHVTAVGLARLLHHRRDKPVDLLGQGQAFQGWVLLNGDAAPQFIPANAQRRLAEALSKILDR